MRRLSRSVVILAMSGLMFLGCSRFESPLDSQDEPSTTRINTPPAPAPGGMVEFSDDFETGLDPTVWYREVLGGVQWTHTTQGGNGFIYSPAQQSYDRNNRMTEILTWRDDFCDFTMTWDMRFHTKSWHRDHRYVHFRSDNAPNPHGYVVHIGVWIPTIPDHVLQIRKRNPDGSGVRLHPAYVSYPWTLDQWYSFKLEVSGNVFKLKVWPKGDPEPAAWIIEAVDPDATYDCGRIGFADYWGSVTDADNVVVTSPAVDFDIKPGSCPNAFNLKAKGVLPVAILGTDQFDVNDIDPSTILLEGVQPIRWSVEDVGTPFVGNECDCHEEGADGWDDLTLKFKRQELAAVLGARSHGEVIPLSITGMLLDGTPFEGGDCIVIKGKGDLPDIGTWGDGPTLK